DQPAITVIEDVAMESELVAVASLSFHLARPCEEMRRLPDQIEGHIGEAEIHLLRRGVATMFAKALAKDQAVVAEPQQIVEKHQAFARNRRGVESPLSGGMAREVDRGQ